MRKKRSWTLIVAGAGCALLAVILVHHQLSSGKPAQPAVEGTDILLASRDIQYGELLVLEGKGDGANVIKRSGWPKNNLPAGALTNADDITEHSVRAADDFVKHEVILKPKTIPDDEFVPPDMKVERIGVGKDDIRSGRVRAGMVADLFRVVGNEPRIYMRNVRVYAVGALDARGRPVRWEEPSAMAHLLIRSEDYLTFLRAKLSETKFLLLEAEDPSLGGPLLVDDKVKEEARREEVQVLLEDGGALMATGDYEKALPILERATDLHPDLTDLCVEAAKQVRACREKLARKRYEQALRAVEQDQDYAVAVHHLDTIDSEFSDVESVVREAAKLRRRAEEALEKSRAQVRFEAAVKDLEVAMTGGDVPQAVLLMAELKQLQTQGFEPEGEQSLAEAVAKYERDVQQKARAYDNDKMVLESYIRQGNLGQAREKLAQIKGKFPQHPGLAELEALVPSEEAGL